MNVIIKNLLLLGALLISLCLNGCSLFSKDSIQTEPTKGTAVPVVTEQTEIKEEPKPANPQIEQPQVKEGKPLGSYIVIKKSRFALTMYDEQHKEIFCAPCALGKNPGQKTKRGDMKTPNGTFVVDEVIDSSWWTHDFGDGKGEIKDAYGPWFISLDTAQLSRGKWDGIGIHGTHDPASIGTLVSEGCIRLKNEDITALKQLVRVGMKVTIEE